jgi:hypothetical protein
MDRLDRDDPFAFFGAQRARMRAARQIKELLRPSGGALNTARFARVLNSSEMYAEFGRCRAVRLREICARYIRV